MDGQYNKFNNILESIERVDFYAFSVVYKKTTCYARGSKKVIVLFEK